MSYTQIYYHIIFSTKNREPILNKAKRRELYNYIWGILKHKQCHVYRIGGTADHIHILMSLHATQSLSETIKAVKVSTNKWIHDNHVFEGFKGWQGEYGAFTKSHAEHQIVKNYIMNQEEHHKTVSFIDEFKQILRNEGIKFEEKYLV